jgi:hypothetical protein
LSPATSKFRKDEEKKQTLSHYWPPGVIEVAHRRGAFGVITDDRFFPSPQLAFHAAEKVAADTAANGGSASSRRAANDPPR